MRLPIQYNPYMIIGLIIIALFPSKILAADFLKMTKETLLTKIGTDKVIIIDVRSEKDWVGSQHKIKGAIREDAARVKTWMMHYSKSSSIVAYCA